MSENPYIKSRLRSFAFAFNGLRLMLHGQYNFFIHLLLAAIAIVLGLYFDISQAEWLWIVLAIGLVLAAEVFNSSIEHLTDLIQKERHPQAGKVKDLAAAAVLITAATALIIGLFVFIPYFLDLF